MSVWIIVAVLCTVVSYETGYNKYCAAEPWWGRPYATKAACEAAAPESGTVLPLDSGKQVVDLALCRELPVAGEPESLNPDDTTGDLTQREAPGYWIGSCTSDIPPKCSYQKINPL